jgi:hypothetical protein
MRQKMLRIAWVIIAVSWLNHFKNLNAMIFIDNFYNGEPLKTPKSRLAAEAKAEFTKVDERRK